MENPMIDYMDMNEKMALLDKAKDAYYNSGEALMSDDEYNALEEELGLSNRSYVGSRSGSYTIRHSFIMGSIAKTQVKRADGSVNWPTVTSDIRSALSKANGDFGSTVFEVTPKLDGCSFSAEFRNDGGRATLVSCATRGDGRFGTDIRHWFEPHLKTERWDMIDGLVNAVCTTPSDILCIRGEVLIPLSVYGEKYADEYVNPRAFVSGVLGVKFPDADEEDKRRGGDLHFVCYDYRVVRDGRYEEIDFISESEPSYGVISGFKGHAGEMIDLDACMTFKGGDLIDGDNISYMYGAYDDYRRNRSAYALDGIVVKPCVSARVYNDDRDRPADCIAIKFMPMISSTEITGIEWNVKKTGEYFPTALLRPIVMEDGKTISRASFHNYNYIMKNNVGVGSRVRVSLAGDIIPFIYEIVEHVDADGNIMLPSDSYVVTDEKSGTMHLMKAFTESEREKNSFMSSCGVLGIYGIGPSAAERIYDAMSPTHDGLDNVIRLMNEDSYREMASVLGDSRSTENIVAELRKTASAITLGGVIRSFCFKMCGDVASETCARIIRGETYSVAGLPSVSYAWALDGSSRETYLVRSAAEALSLDLTSAPDDDTAEDTTGRTAVILTGSPEKSGFRTKGDFMRAHAGLVETTSWKDVMMLITDDMSSNSSKMQKARKNGVEIRTYQSFVKVNGTEDDAPSGGALF